MHLEVCAMLEVRQQASHTGLMNSRACTSRERESPPEEIRAFEQSS